MDRFPQYPPHDESDGIPASDMDALRMWILLIGGTAAWVLALLAAGYWIAGAAPDLGAYIHGVLLGTLLGSIPPLLDALRSPRSDSTKSARKF